MFQKGKWKTTGLWIGVAVGVLLILNLVFWVLGQQTGQPRGFTTAAFDGSGQSLQFRRNYYCWPETLGAKDGVHEINVGFGDRRVLHAEAFLSGFNVWSSPHPLPNLDRVRAEAEILSIEDNKARLRLTYAFSFQPTETPDFVTAACIDWTVLAITVPR